MAKKKEETPKQETFLDRLNAEKSDLSERLEKLTSFIHSDKFQSVSSNQRRLLKLQVSHMRDYLSVLDERLKELS